MNPMPAEPSSGEALECDVAVLGGGPGGYAAAFRAADLGLRTVLIERHATLGGVCLNVGCIPSKALLHVAAVIDAARALAPHGVEFGAPRIDLERLRAFKNRVVGRLTGGLAAMAKMRKVTVLQGTGVFADAHRLAVRTAAGEKTVRFAAAIVAVGSRAARLPLQPQDPRVWDSTAALELPEVPTRMLVVGGGIIGLEMGSVYATLGARLDVVELTDGLMPGADRDLVELWRKSNAKRFERVLLGTRVTGMDARPEGLQVSFDRAEPALYDRVLVCVGRVPRGREIGAERAGLAVDENGFIPVDGQMRTRVPHIYAIGDCARAPMLAHKAVHEGHVAAECAAGLRSHFDARVIPSVAYTDPEIAWAGLTEEEARAKGVPVEVARFPWAASGRAVANAREDGLTKLLFDAATHRLLGGAVVGTSAGDLIGEIALAIEMGADATDIGKTIHPHPTLCETVGLAAEWHEGVCTDLPPRRRS